RFRRALVDWGYATWPLIILLCAAAWRRNPILLAGALAPVPWVVLSMLAVRDVGLQAYYSFPLMMTIGWPTVAYPRDPFAVRLQLFLAVTSIALFAACGGPNLDRAPWKSLGIPDFEVIGRYERQLHEAIGQREKLGRLMLDNAVVSLV